MNSTVATSAAPIGRPGWPDLACSTASIAKARMALAIWAGATAEAAADATAVEDAFTFMEKAFFVGLDSM